MKGKAMDIDIAHIYESSQEEEIEGIENPRELSEEELDGIVGGDQGGLGGVGDILKQFKLPGAGQ
jgi:hypothetical protein